MSEQKNMIAAAALSFLVIVVWTMFFAPTPPPPAPAESPAAVAGGADAPVAAGPAPLLGAPADASETRADALAEEIRIPFETPKLTGTISTLGGRLDDLHLANYRETLDPEADTVVTLSPVGTQHPYYALYGWVPSGGSQTGPTPDARTVWTIESGEALTPDSPILLRWENGAGLTFRRAISVDEHYMFTVRQTVENGTDETLTLQPYGLIARHGEPVTENFFILHEGAIGMFDGELAELDYDDLADLPPVPAEGGVAESRSVAENGWIGFTDKYWMTVMLPEAGQSFSGVFKTTGPANAHIYQTDVRLPAVTVAPGATAEATTRLFAGAKEYDEIVTYSETLGIDRFDDAIDWGWFFFLTKPIFQLLLFINGIIGNVGWSIIVLTLVIKTVLFPLAYKSYVSMSKMKKLQPEMEKIKERAGDDKMKLQQEMMALYKKEGANPAAGCLPILLQIPIFFSLYKVIFVSLELRHAPWIGWYQDLSVRDPSSIINLFGLLPFDAPDPTSFLGIFSIGILPVIMGITMWLQQKLNPAPTDPIQQQIFALMPIMFTFLLGSFASGLVLYWIANNTLTIIQQYSIMRSQGVDVDLLGNIRSSFKKKPKAD